MTRLETEQKLADSIARKEELLNELREFLFVNRGRRSTHNSDHTILSFAEDLNTVGYNIAWYKRLIIEQDKVTTK